VLFSRINFMSNIRKSFVKFLSGSPHEEPSDYKGKRRGLSIRLAIKRRDRVKA
jgi:hypothetical protein